MGDRLRQRPLRQHNKKLETSMIPLNKRFIALLVSLLLGFVSVGCAAEQKPGDIIAEGTRLVVLEANDLSNDNSH